MNYLSILKLLKKIMKLSYNKNNNKHSKIINNNSFFSNKNKKNNLNFSVMPLIETFSHYSLTAKAKTEFLGLIAAN
jgi:hypothetical protein